jgi:hypothetical protein
LQPNYGQAPQQQYPQPQYPNAQPAPRGGNRDLRGQVVTLYPFSEQGAVAPSGLDIRPFVYEFHLALAQKLTQAGLDVRAPMPGVPAEGYAITGRFVRFSPGSAWAWFFLGILSYFSGNGIEAEGQVGDAQGPYGQLHQFGRMRSAMPGMKNLVMKQGSRRVGQKMAQQAIAILKTR